MAIEKEGPAKFDRRKKVWADATKLADYIEKYRESHNEYPHSPRIMLDFQWSQRMLETRRDVAYMIMRERGTYKWEPRSQTSEPKENSTAIVT